MNTIMDRNMILSHSLQPKIIAIVPSAGSGKRMLSETPKQYIKIKNRTIIEYTLLTLLSHPNIIQIIVSLNQNDSYFKNLSLASDNRIFSVVGGEERMNSVLSGLIIDTDADWVIIHDAVRPCLAFYDLEKLISITKISSVGGILANPVINTIKCGDIKKEKVLYTVDRKNLWHALTPQLFSLNLLRYCFQRTLEDDINITDEASALEYCGYNPLLILGSFRNIKITYPEDLILAEFYLKKYYKIK